MNPRLWQHAKKTGISFFAQKNIPEINAIWIDEDYRRQGLVTALIKWIENLARKEDYQQIEIGVGLYKDYGPCTTALVCDSINVTNGRYCNLPNES